jgi:hypothetical protein
MRTKGKLGKKFLILIQRRMYDANVLEISLFKIILSWNLKNSRATATIQKILIP